MIQTGHKSVSTYLDADQLEALESTRWRLRLTRSAFIKRALTIYCSLIEQARQQTVTDIMNADVLNVDGYRFARKGVN